MAPVEMPEKRPTTNPTVNAWVDSMARLLKPDRVVWCDGSPEERKRLTEEAVAAKVLLPLDQKKLPGCYFHHSNPNDVARVEHLTFICTPTREEAGPTNNWMEPGEAYAKLTALYDGAMKRPHPVRHPLRDGAGALPLRQGRHRAHRLALRGPQHGPHDAHGQRGPGAPRRRRQRLQPRRPLDPRVRTPTSASSATSPRTTPSGRWARATAATRCSARSAWRCASPRYLARREGWLAEHMLILEAESPTGEKHYVAARLPLRLRQDQLRHAHPAQGASPAGRSAPSATTSPGCGWATTAACGRSTRSSATSAWRRAPTARPTPTPWSA